VAKEWALGKKQVRLSSLMNVVSRIITFQATSEFPVYFANFLFVIVSG